jgi:DNA replication and repair protein RecF
MSSFGQNPHLYLGKLFIKNFRNIHELDLTFGPRHNLFIGKNGHGKTNCLEAIAMASSLRPMQALQNSDLIKFNEHQAKIMAHFFSPQQLKIEVDIFPNGKKAKINERSLKNVSQLVKYTPLVSFIPAELNMVFGSAHLRRRAIDQIASSLFFEHLEAQKAYEKILLHRNRLLKNWPIDHRTLFTFTELLIKEGARIIFFRLKAIEHTLNIFAEKITTILGPNYTGNIRYFLRDRYINTHTESDLVSLLVREKAHVEQQEYKRNVTLFGPHLDDLIFEINGIDAKKFASRGQSRAIVLSFKLAQMIVMHQIRGLAPIIILDDIVSELDADSKTNLISAIYHLNTQVFFSTTELTNFGDLIPHDKIYHLDNGDIKAAIVD